MDRIRRKVERGKYRPVSLHQHIKSGLRLVVAKARPGCLTSHDSTIPPGRVTVLTNSSCRDFSEHQLSPTPVATPRTQIRRIYFDLIGLPPAPEVVDAFVANPSDKAYLKIVDDLLSSHRYGERWARHWLDVVRFGESNGFERNDPRLNFWYFRDWVINSLNNDMPYDEFSRMQLIGDLIKPGPEGAASTGFLVAGIHNTVVGGSERMKKLAKQDELEEIISAVGQTFLGLTINCARCHDHKFDPIKQTEYYQMISTISGVKPRPASRADS